MADETLAVAINARGAVVGGKTYERAVNSMTGANQVATKIMNVMKSTVLKLFAVIGAGVAIRQTIVTISSFEDAMGQLQGVTRATEEDMLRFNETARTLGATTRFTAGEAGNALVSLSRAGFDVVESTTAVGATLDLATGQMLDLNESTQMVAASLRQFQLEADQAERVADVLTNTANSAATDVRELSQAMSFGGVAANAIGVEIEETAAILGVLADNQIKATRGGMGLRSAITRLVAPTNKAKQAIKELGLHYDDVNPEKVGLTTALERLGQANLDVEKATKIFGQRQFVSAIIMTRNIEAIRELTKANKEAESASRAAAEIMEQKLSGIWKELKSTVQELMLVIGEAGFTGALITSIKFITAVTRELFNMKGKADDVSTAVAITTMAIKAMASALAMTAIVSAPMIIAGIGVAIKKVGTIISLFTIKVWAMNKALIASAITMAKKFIAGLVAATTKIFLMGKAILTALMPALLVFAAAYAGIKFGQWLEQFEPVQKGMQIAIKWIARSWVWVGKQIRLVWIGMKTIIVDNFLNPLLKGMEDGIRGIQKFAKETAIILKRAAKAYGMDKLHDQLAKVVAASSKVIKLQIETPKTSGFEAQAAIDDYEEAVKKINNTHELAIAKIEKNSDKAKKSMQDLIIEDIAKIAGGWELAKNKLGGYIDKLRGPKTDTKEIAGVVTGIADAWGFVVKKIGEATDNVAEFNKKSSDTSEKATKSATDLGITMNDVGQSASGAITDMVLGANSFLDTVNNIVESLLRMVIQRGVESLFPAPKAGKGLVAMASGGVVTGPTPALIGEAGPEAVIPLEKGTNGKLGLKTRGNTQTNVSFNLYSPDARGIKNMMLRDPKLIRQMNTVYKQGYAVE